MSVLLLQLVIAWISAFTSWISLISRGFRFSTFCISLSSIGAFLWIQGRLSLSTVGDKCAKDNFGGILLKV